MITLQTWLHRNVLAIKPIMNYSIKVIFLLSENFECVQLRSQLICCQKHDGTYHILVKWGQSKIFLS